MASGLETAVSRIQGCRSVGEDRYEQLDCERSAARHKRDLSVAGVRDVGGLEDDGPDDEEWMEVDMDDPDAMRKLNVYFQTCAILSAADSDGARAESVVDQLHMLVCGGRGAEG